MAVAGQGITRSGRLGRAKFSSYSSLVVGSTTRWRPSS